MAKFLRFADWVQERFSARGADALVISWVLSMGAAVLGYAALLTLLFYPERSLGWGLEYTASCLMVVAWPLLKLGFALILLSVLIEVTLLAIRRLCGVSK